MHADGAGRLRQDQIAAERHAELVPGEAGEDQPAQPFGGRQRHGERDHASGAGRPEEPREREAEGRKDGEIGGQAQHPEGQQPDEFRFGEEGRAQPPQAGHEIAQAPPPPGGRRRPERGGEIAARRPPGDVGMRAAVDQPDRQRHRHDDRRDDIEGRHRQGTDGAGQQRDEAPAPTVRENHGLGEAEGREEAGGGGACAHGAARPLRRSARTALPRSAAFAARPDAA